MRTFIPKKDPPRQPAFFPITRSGTVVPSAAATTRFTHDFSQIPLQAKLTASAPGDLYEQEADRISAQVIQDPEHERPQTRRAGASGSGGTQVPPIVHEVLSSPGRPLDPAARTLMEHRFGHDFSGVRVHTGQLAELSTEAVGAQAYTVGSDVVFGAGRYTPASHNGRRLLAHELTHVVQQGASPAPSTVLQRQPKPDPKAGQAKTTKPKTLKEMGISAQDPISVKTMVPLIDAVFQRNPTIAPYVGGTQGRLAQGREIAEKGKLIVHRTKGDFENAYKRYAGKITGDLPRGFYWEDEEVSKGNINVRDEIHLPPDATFGEAFHEAVHKMSAGIHNHLSDDPDFAFDVNEGLTSLFSVLILKDEGVTDYTDGYASRRRKAQKLVDHATLDAVAKWYWAGDRQDLLRKLGVQAGSKNESRDFIRKLKKIM